MPLKVSLSLILITFLYSIIFRFDLPLYREPEMSLEYEYGLLLLEFQSSLYRRVFLQVIFLPFPLGNL